MGDRSGGVIAMVVLYAILLLLLTRRLSSGGAVAVRLKQVEQQDSGGFVGAQTTGGSFLDRVAKPFFERLSQRISSLLPINEDSRAQLSQSFRSAGWNISVQTFLGAVVILSLFLMLPLGVSFGLGGVVIAPLVVYVLARFALSSAVTTRNKRIESSLPDTLDLLSSSVSAGLSFDQGLLNVCQRTNGPLTDELAQTQREISLGVPRSEALRNLSNRCDSESVTAFVSAVSQADRLGVPIGSILDTQADMARDSQQQRLEEEAGKLPIKMLFPMVGLIFPCIFVVLLMPAMMNMMSTLASM